MRNLVITILVFGLIILFCKSASATSYHLYPSDNLANTITNNTCSWDVVYIHEGVHTLDADVNISGKSLPIVGDGSDKTIILLDDHIFRFYKTKNNNNPMIVTISGITFKNSKTGESIYFENYIPQTSMDIVISDCKFDNIGDVAFISAVYEIRDYKRTINRCDIYYGQSSPIEINSENKKDNNYKSMTVKIVGSNFFNSGNLTVYSFSPESKIDFKLSNSVLRNNTTGIQIFGPVTMYLNNNLIVRNFKGVLLDSENSIGFLHNNTIDSNGESNGYGIYNRGTLNLENNIISNNNYGIYNDGQITQSNNILWNNQSNSFTSQEDFFLFDPNFTIGPNGEYYLREHSEAIDRGSNSASYFNLNSRTTSLYGKLDRGVVDLGYHYPSKYKLSLLDRLMSILILDNFISFTIVKRSDED